MSLKLYKKKRNFSKTPEPSGKKPQAKNNLYVIQKHAASHLHYDFRLELNGILLSWAVPKGPCLDPAVKRLAVHVEDHPVEYGSFEGVIPQGQYGGGTVMLWDTGKWYAEDEDPQKAYQKGHLHFILEGKKLKGRWSLIKFGKDEKSWFLVKSKDKYAKSLQQFDIIQKKPGSVASGGKKLDQIILPELATLVDQPPEGDQWLHELKLDGYRILAFKNANSVKLLSRKDHDWTTYFPNIAKAIKKIPISTFILDGEIVLLDEKEHSNFQLLQNAIKKKTKKPFIYYIFDILHYDQFNIMPLPLLERKKILETIVPSNQGILRLNDYVIGSGRNVFLDACNKGFEGVVSKKIESPYVQRRTNDWVKVKCLKRQEFVVGGYTKPKGLRKYFGSLFLGFYNEKKQLVFCGNVGTGFNQDSLKNIYDLLQKNKTSLNPFNTRPPGSTTAIWVKPKVVVEIEFTEWTQDERLRHPSFKGLRKDKSAIDVIKEKEIPIKKMHLDDSLPFKLTNPNKMLYPKDQITKRDLLNYYDEIQEWIMPYLINRPLSLVRCPNNVESCFFQRHLENKITKLISSIEIQGKTKKEKYIYLDNVESLFALVQMNVLEIHPWGSTVDDIEFPDYITFDLDPAPSISWKKIMATAFLMKKELEAINLKSFLKVTGGKGLHVVVPIKPEHDWDEVKNFAHVFVKYLVTNNPSQYVSEMSKSKRKGKIFIDYMRNMRGATAIAPYSTRARNHAPVAVPIHWDELTSDPKDTFYTLKTLPDRLKTLKHDPWGDFFKMKQSLAILNLSKK